MALLIGLALGPGPRAAEADSGPRVFAEDFSTNPLERGWELFGEAELFQWDAAGQNLRVTWDSSRSNSYLALPLGMTLTRAEDFSAALDLTLLDLTPGATEGKPGALQLAFGFQNRGDAQAAGFARGTGTDSPNLVEFNFFADTGFGATLWPAALTTNSGVNYNGPEDYTLFDLPLNLPMRISLEYRAGDETIRIAIRTNGVLAAPLASARLATNSTAFSQPFTDFAVDAFALPSYSERGQAGDFAGSLLAHGVIDNIEVTAPPLPVRELRIEAGPAGLQVSFLSRTGWRYSVERASDLRNWEAMGESAAGSGGRISVSDPRFGRAAGQRFYRVSARRGL